MAIPVPGLGDSNSTPALKPAFRIEQGSSGSSGLMAVAGDLLGMSKPDPWAACISRLWLDLQLAPGVDHCTLEAVGTNMPKLATGDSLTVKLGYADQLTQVYNGKVARISSAHDGLVQIVLDNGALTLARLRQNSSFEQQTLSGIVNRLLADASLPAGRIDTGADFPFLALDDRQSLWQWISTLAAHSGCRVWMNSNGELQVKPGGGPASIRLKYGQDILEWHHVQAIPPATQTQVITEGAAGSQGSNAWSWLSKKSKSNTAKDGRGELRQQSSALLRNVSAGQNSARFWKKSLAAQGNFISITVPGNASLSPGSSFNLQDCPQGRGDGDYVITRVRHYHDKRQGFVSRVDGSGGESS